MLNDYTVNVIYKNRSLESVSERIYPLADYCQELKLGIMRTIMDVENAFYRFQNGKNKEQWEPDVLECFQRIRHKLLDSANSIERVPSNLQYKGSNVNKMNAADYIADVFDNIAANK